MIIDPTDVMRRPISRPFNPSPRTALTRAGLPVLPKRLDNERLRPRKPTIAFRRGADLIARRRLLLPVDKGEQSAQIVRDCVGPRAQLV
jgi:hypothetical protein